MSLNAAIWPLPSRVFHDRRGARRRTPRSGRPCFSTTTRPECFYSAQWTVVVRRDEISLKLPNRTWSGSTNRFGVSPSYPDGYELLRTFVVFSFYQVSLHVLWDDKKQKRMGFHVVFFWDVKQINCAVTVLIQYYAVHTAATLGQRLRWIVCGLPY